MIIAYVALTNMVLRGSGVLTVCHVSSIFQLSDRCCRNWCFCFPCQHGDIMDSTALYSQSGQETIPWFYSRAQKQQKLSNLWATVNLGKFCYCLTIALPSECSCTQFPQWWRRVQCYTNQWVYWPKAQESPCCKKKKNFLQSGHIWTRLCLWLPHKG